MINKFLALTSFKGRLSRRMYFGYIAAIFGIAGVSILIGYPVAKLLAGSPQVANIAQLVLMGISMVLINIVFFSAVVRRLHDANLNGYWALLFFLLGAFWPLLAIATLILGCIPARSENNKYDMV